MKLISIQETFGTSGVVLSFWISAATPLISIPAVVINLVLKSNPVFLIVETQMEMKM